MSIVVIIAAFILLVATIICPVMSLAFYLNTTLFKAWAMVTFSFFRAVDFTVVCAVLVLLAMAYNFMKTGLRLRETISVPLAIYLALAVVLFLGATYTSAPNYGLQKSSRFATLGLVAFFAPIGFGHSLREVKLMIWIVLVSGIVFAIGTMIDPEAGVLRALPEARAGFLEAGPLGTATRIGMASVIALVFLTMAHTSLLQRVSSLALIVLMMVAIIITGSRGPFIGLALTWLATIIICHRGESKALVPVITTVILVALVVSFAILPQLATERIATVWRSGYELKEATHSRTEMFVWAVKRFPECPILGHGTGAFAVDRGGQDVRDYPHNIIVEVLYEDGLVGVFIISLFLWLIFRRWLQGALIVRLYELDIGMYQVVHITGLLFFFVLTQAMKSGDINDNRIMFFCAGLVIAAFNLARRTAHEISPEGGLMVKGQQHLKALEFEGSGIAY